MHLKSVLSAARPPALHEFRPAYNLFRRKCEPDLLCAVPEDRPVPRFLSATLWEFAGKGAEPAAGPLGSDQRAAGVGVRLNGFYLFAAFSAVRETAAVQRVRWAA